jgi:sulfate transport system substrate-binding protein
VLVVPLVAVTLAAAACGGSSGDQAAEAGAGAQGGATLAGTINLVSYSTPQAAFEKIISAWKKTAAGKGVTFTQSYGASGDQSRAVAAGQPADVVEFSLEPDITRLVKANLVASDWNGGETKGMVTRSVVVLAVRKGNPEHIKGWADLVKPGIEVITPNPFTSGGARWNVMAAYGAQIEQGKTEAQATEYLAKLFANVPVQDDSARKALETFTSGKGDVMLAYENEAIFARHQGVAIDYVVPDQTILIENPVAVTSTSKNAAAAKAFVDFLHTDQAQQIFADNGYRPVVDGVADGDFPTPKQLFDITKLGGWDAVSKKFFDPTSSVMATIEQGLGVQTSK